MKSEDKVFDKEDLERKVLLKAGDKAPEFELKNADEINICLKDFNGKNIILYFYPKDNTPGCTTEACEFSQNYDEFIKNDTIIIGISPDNAKSHVNFTQKYSLKHIILSDEEHDVAKIYGVWQVRKNYGKQYLGIVRTTFLIDKNGYIAKVYKNVKAAGHAINVLADLAK